MADAGNFKPPYLNYAIAADLAKIKSQVAALSLQAVRNYALSSPAVAATGSITPGVVLPPDSPVRGSSTLAPKIMTASVAPRDHIARQVSQTATGQSSGSTAKTAVQSGYIDISPKGTVMLGFNCRETFKATVSSLISLITHTVWKLKMKNPVSGAWEQVYFLGGNLTIDKKGQHLDTIHFEMDYGTYHDMAYLSSNNTVQFAIEVTPYILMEQKETVMSDPVTLDFKTTSCNGIHHVTLQPDTVVGGANGDDPTLTVFLEAPAGPGGQPVSLATNTNHGGLHANSFVIPAGQTHGAISGFVGTNRVRKVGVSFDIVAQLTAPGGKSNPANATLYLTKP